MHKARAFFFVCAGCLCLAAVLLPVPASAQAPTYITQWGSYGSGNGQFICPWGLALDGSGNVYVTDSGNNRVQVFASDGTYLTQWGSLGSGIGQFSHTGGIAADGSGHVYVADYGNNRVQAFGIGVGYLTQWEVAAPSNVAVDGSGNVYVTNLSGLVKKFTGGGNYLTEWVQVGRHGGSCADNNGYFYVTDYLGHCVQKFTTVGGYSTQWGVFGIGPGQFSYPLGVFVDGGGTVYVVDSGFNTYTGTDVGGNRIQVFASDGTYLTQWGMRGSGPGQFYRPHAVVVNSHGEVYVADTFNHRIQVFSSLPVPAKSTTWGRLKSLYR